MGIISETCKNCSKKTDEPEDLTKSIVNPNTIKISIEDNDSGSVPENECKQSNNKILSKSKKKLLKSSFLFTNLFNKSPFESYEIIKEISPSLKTVRLKNNEKVRRLMKVIDGKNILNDEKKKKDFKEDIKSLQFLDHPNIDKIFEVFIYEDFYYLICNYAEENNLIEKIKNVGLEEESKINTIMNQLLNSIIFLHESDIFKIELDLHNFMVYEISIKSKKTTLRKKGKKADPNTDDEKKENEKVEIKRKTEVKLSVLGYLNENYSLELEHLIFYPPEIIEQIENENMKKNSDEEEENDKTDEWACGVIMYYLITGEFPFQATEKEELFENIKNKEIDFSSSKFESMSDSCKDLLAKLLEKDKAKRISAKECLEHPFFTGESFIKEEEKEDVDVELLSKLLTVEKPKSKFHELINAYLCFHFLDKEEEKKLSDVFKYIDKDHNNYISENDIKNALEQNNIKSNDEQIYNIFYAFDYDHNDSIQYQEFLRVLCDKKDLHKEENMESVFNAIDIDKNQFISIEDIQKFVPNDEEIKNKVKKEFTEPFGMKNNDKMIYDQFCELIRKNKTYAEVDNFKSRAKKAKIMKEKLTLEGKEAEDEKLKITSEKKENENEEEK